MFVRENDHLKMLCRLNDQPLAVRQVSRQNASQFLLKAHLFIMALEETFFPWTDGNLTSVGEDKNAC